MTPDELLAALVREPTQADRVEYAVRFASYQAFLAGVKWGAEHGLGEGDDAGQAWSDWFEEGT